jgi:hypothetical protein
MAKLSSASWMVHDLGLAASLGGTLFGRVALQPALHKVALPEERDLVSADAWQRFSWINLASHAAFAVPWFMGRAMLGGREVSDRARSLTRAKDTLIIASLVAGVSSILLGRVLAKRGIHGRGPQAIEEQRFSHTERDIFRTRAIKRSVGMLGMLDMLATASIAAVTTLLAMEGQKSTRWSPLSRLLP